MISGLVPKFLQAKYDGCTLDIFLKAEQLASPKSRGYSNSFRADFKSKNGS